MSKKETIKIASVNLIIFVCLLFICVFFLNLYADRNDLRRLKQIYIYMGESENLSHVLKPNSVTYLRGIEYRINSLGFRDREYPSLKPENHYRILCVGDSFTFGQGVKLDDAYSKVLERKLQEKYSKNIEVINAGVFGYNTYDEYWYIKNKLLTFNPDLIILGFYIGNDPEDRAIEFNNKMLIQDYNSHPLVYYLKTKFNNKNLEKENYWESYMEKMWEPQGPQWKRCVKALRDIGDTLKIKNIKLLVLIIPIGESNLVNHLAYHHQLIETLEKFNIDYVDVLPEMIKTGISFIPVGREESHPNATMHNLYASVILKAIEDKGLIQR